MEDSSALRAKTRPLTGNRTTRSPTLAASPSSLSVRGLQRPSTASPPSRPNTARFTTKRGLSDMASVLDALESKLKDAGINVDGGSEITKGEITGNLKREFIDKELAALIADLNLSLDPTSKFMKPSLSEEQVSYTLLHRALRELIREKQLCATEVESMRNHLLEKEADLVADLHHAHALKDALAEKLRNTEASLSYAHQQIQSLKHRKQVLKENLEEERESVGALLKQKLHVENSLDSANAHVSSLTTASGVYESKLNEATDRMMILSKQQMRMENKQNIEAVAYESKIANLSKVNAERKEALERSTAELSDMSRQNQVLRSQLAASQTQLNHMSQRLAERHQSDMKALEAHRRSARERERERERDKIDPPTGVVTLVFTDVQGSTAQWEANPEIMTIALDVHFRVMREHMVRVGGYECKTEGDAFMIAFQSALQAVHWCMFVQEALLVADWPPALMNNEHSQEEKSPDGRLLFRGLRVRIGAHSGTPQCHLDPVSKRMDYFGPMVNRAARVSGLAHGGQVVVSGRTWREVEADISGVDVVHLGEHTLKGIKGKEQIIQVLPITLAGRKFPPLNDSDAKKPHFEERAAAPLPPLITTMPPQDDEEETNSPPPAHSQSMPPAFIKMREFARYLPEGAPQGEMLMVVNEAERQLRMSYDEIDELKNSRRALVSRITDNEGRLAALDELEAEAAEWRGMVDNLTAERRALEDLVRAEHAEKEFFLKKLMDSNKELHGLPSGSGQMKKAEDMEVPDFIALPDKEKVEVFMRINSKIRALEAQLKVLQAEKGHETSRTTLASQLEVEKQRENGLFTSTMLRTVQQVMNNAAQNEQEQTQPQRLSTRTPGRNSNPQLLISPKPSFNENVTFEKEKELQTLTERAKTMEQVITKLTVEHAAKVQSSQNHIASLLQRLAEAENALVVANSQIKTEPKVTDLEKISTLTKDNQQLKQKIRDLEDELEALHRGKEEMMKQWKDFFEPSTPRSAKGRRNSSSLVPLQIGQIGKSADVATLVKKLKTYKERIEELEAEKRGHDHRGHKTLGRKEEGEGHTEIAVVDLGERFMEKERREEKLPSPRIRRSSVSRLESPLKEEIFRKMEKDKREGGRERDARSEKSNSSSNSNSDDESWRDEKMLKGRGVKKNEGGYRPDMKKQESRLIEIMETQLSTIGNQVTTLETKNEVVAQENARLLERIAQLETDAKEKEREREKLKEKEMEMEMEMKKEREREKEKEKEKERKRDKGKEREKEREREKEKEREREKEKEREREREMERERDRKKEEDKEKDRERERKKEEEREREREREREKAAAQLPPPPPSRSSRRNSGGGPSDNFRTFTENYRNYTENYKQYTTGNEGKVGGEGGEEQVTSSPRSRKLVPAQEMDVGPSTLPLSPSPPPFSAHPPPSHSPSPSPPPPSATPLSLPNVNAPGSSSPTRRTTPSSPAFNKPGGWSQIAADMEHELEELENDDRPPSTNTSLASSSSIPKALIGVRVKQSSDNSMAKKGQQYLNPIMQKSKHSSSQGSSPTLMLGLSGKSFG